QHRYLTGRQTAASGSIINADHEYRLGKYVVVPDDNSSPPHHSLLWQRPHQCTDNPFYPHATTRRHVQKQSGGDGAKAAGYGTDQSVAVILGHKPAEFRACNPV